MSVSIIGCGWLGQALAQALMAENVKVLASYQSQQTLTTLQQLNIPATKLTLPITGMSQEQALCFNDIDVDEALFQNDVLVIALPPQLKKGRLDYPLKIQQLVSMAELGATKKIILLNSTAIYNGLVGEVDENTRLDLKAPKVEVLLAAEKAVQVFTKDVCILRLAGLVGPSRHPGKFLQADRLFNNASAQVNLVHQLDVVNIIKKFIEATGNNCSEIYNVVSATKSDRKQYYQVAARAMALPIPKFEPETTANSGKNVQGVKLRKALNYHYQHDDLLLWASSL